MGRAIKDLTVTASPSMDSATISALAALSGLVRGAALPQARSLRPAHANSVISNSRSHAQETSNFLKRRAPKA
jgi:hypothetical protein